MAGFYSRDEGFLALFDFKTTAVAHQQGHEHAVATTDEVAVLETWKGNLAAGTVLRGTKLPAMPIKVGGKPGDLVLGQRS